MRYTRYGKSNLALFVMGMMVAFLGSAFIFAGAHKFGIVRNGFLALYSPMLMLPLFLLTYRWCFVGAVAMWCLTIWCSLVARLEGILGLMIIPIGFLVIASLISSRIIWKSKVPNATDS